MSVVREARPALATIACLAGFLALLVTVQAVLGSGGHRAEARSAEFFTWSALVSAGVVVYVLVFLRTLRLVHAPSRAALAVSAAAYAVVGFVVVVALTGHGPTGALATVHLVMRPLYAVAVTAAAPAVIGLWLVHGRLRTVDARLADGETDRLLDELLTSSADLGRCLAGLSLIASTGLINTAALRSAYLAHGLAPSRFPFSSVLLYGAALTGVVALIYIPARIAWRERAAALLDAVYPVPADARPAEEWAGGRARLRDLLAVDATVPRTLAVAFGILAPLATSLLAGYLAGLTGGR